MATQKISELPEITTVEEGDFYIITDVSDGDATKKVKAINTEEKIGVYGYVSTPLPTTIATPGAYVTLAGTFTNPVLDNFTVSVTDIKYTGISDITVEIHWAGSFYSNVNNPTVTVSIAVNTVIQDCSGQSTKLGVAGEYGNMSGICVLTLSTNDEILIKMTADVTDKTVTAASFQTSLQKFY